jgi:hypothetical protein
MKGFKWIEVMCYSLPWFNLELMQVPKESWFNLLISFTYEPQSIDDRFQIP